MSDPKSQNIAIRDLNYRVMGQTLLQIDTLDIPGAGPTMILGPNGAGKSLLLRLLHGLIQPVTGGIYFNGGRSEAGAKPRQAMVFQKPVLLRRSVAANIDYALKVSGVSRAERPARQQKLLLDGDLIEHAKQPARTLSGGEQQRLGLVRALACKPEILFLDEPTSSLDPTGAATIEQMIKDISESGTKLVMVTHDLALVQRLGADVVFLCDGKLCEHGPAHRFFKAPQTPEARRFLASRLVL